MKKPTTAMLRALLNLLDGKWIRAHLKTQSDHGGFEGTWRAMVQRGFITDDGELTAKGREVAQNFRDSLAAPKQTG